MSTDGQGTKCHRNIAENFNRLNRVHERYRRQTDRRQTTDGRATANSERSLKTVINNTQLKQYAFHNDDYVSINALKKLETQISAFKCYRNVELFI